MRTKGESFPGARVWSIGERRSIWPLSIVLGYFSDFFEICTTFPSRWFQTGQSYKFFLSFVRILEQAEVRLPLPPGTASPCMMTVVLGGLSARTRTILRENHAT